MFVPPFPLADVDRVDLDRAIDAAVRATVAVLTETDGGPWTAVALYVWDQTPALLPAAVGLRSVADRARAVAAADRTARESLAWVPAEWGHSGELELELEESAAAIDERLREQLFDEEEPPAAWVAKEVARRLMTIDLSNVVGDVVAYPFSDHDGSLLMDVEELAGPAARESLVRDGLLLGPPPRPAGPDAVLADDLVEDAVAAVATALAAALAEPDVDSPWPAMAVRATIQEGQVLPTDLKRCPPARRAEALATRVPGARAMELFERIQTAWEPDWWHPSHGDPDDDGWGEEIEVSLEWPSGLASRQGELHRRIVAEGHDEPGVWLATQACARVNRLRLPSVTPDFVAFATGSDDLFDGSRIASILAAATDEAAASLVADRLLVDDPRKVGDLI